MHVNTTNPPRFRFCAFLGPARYTSFAVTDVNGDTHGQLSTLEINHAPGKAISILVAGRVFAGAWDALESFFIDALDYPAHPIPNFSTEYTSRAAIMREFYGQKWKVAATLDLEEIARRAWNERRNA